MPSDEPPAQRPAHDPLSEEMDLITWQEAAARLFDELEKVRVQLAAFTGEPETEAQRQDLAATRTRRDALQRLADRLAAQRPSGQSADRLPGAGWTR